MRAVEVGHDGKVGALDGFEINGVLACLLRGAGDGGQLVVRGDGPRDGGQCAAGAQGLEQGFHDGFRFCGMAEVAACIGGRASKARVISGRGRPGWGGSTLDSNMRV